MVTLPEGRGRYVGGREMAKDVAERELDQAGFRISNLGDPRSAGDATRTDNATTPKPNAGTGSAGTSYLAAAADHVHPAADAMSDGSAIITLDDPSQQSVTFASRAFTSRQVSWSMMARSGRRCLRTSLESRRRATRRFSPGTLIHCVVLYRRMPTYFSS